MSDELMLSIYVPVYNHEKYIGQALDSILMQKTTYSYEVLIGEDCSTDNSKKILEEYEKKHPNKLTVFYREHNMNNEEIWNAEDLRLRCQGKYIICLEGDDYWVDPEKIQKQIDFLEKNPEYLAVAHNCVVVDKDSKKIDRNYPECKDYEYSLKHYYSEVMPGQLTTLMSRNYYKDKLIDTYILQTNTNPLDRLIYYSLISNGKVYCIQEKMSAYRYVVSGGSSYSANYSFDFEKNEKYYIEHINYGKRINNNEAIKYSQVLYFKNLISGIWNKQCSLKDFFKYIKNIDNKTRTILLFIKRCFRRWVLKKAIWD